MAASLRLSQSRPIIVDATVGLSDPDMVDALRKRYQLIEQRADSLANAAIESEPAWARAVRQSTPDEPVASVLRIIAAFRERWDISGDAPLGPRPGQLADRGHHADYKRLAAMLSHAASRSSAPTVKFGQPRATSDRDL